VVQCEKFPVFHRCIDEKCGTVSLQDTRPSTTARPRNAGNRAGCAAR
jgi:hypothetical protein